METHWQQLQRERRRYIGDARYRATAARLDTARVPYRLVLDADGFAIRLVRLMPPATPEPP